MKYSLFFIASVFVSHALAQSTTTSYGSNVNGDRIANVSTVESGTQKTQITQSINGRQVPMEQTETRVLSESASGKVTETIIRKYDPNGTLGSTQRIITEEQKSGNNLHVHSTAYQSDVNGRMQEFERRTVDSTTNGQSGTKQTAVERPDLNGSFQTVEKRSQTSETSGGNVHTDETVYRPSGNGGFVPATREVADSKQQNGKTVTTAAHYEPRDNQQLILTGQSVTSTVKRTDGSTVSEVSLYGSSGGDGRARERESAPHLREIQTIELVPGPGGTLTQTVTAARPNISDPERMGPARVISQTVCTGTCSNASFGFMH